MNKFKVGDKVRIKSEADYLLQSEINKKRLQESIKEINNNIVDALSMAFEEADEEDDMDNNTITLAQVVVSAANNTNDHIEIDIDNTDITVKQVMKMCEEIEESLDSGNSVVLELWNEPKMAKSGYAASVYEVNNKYIDDGGRLLCSFNNIVI